MRLASINNSAMLCRAPSDNDGMRDSKSAA
jgi:hypothetical protein